MRACELVDLVLAGRVTVKGRQIEVTDTTATGNDRLDDTLAAIGAMNEATVQSWLRGAQPGIGMQYLSRLEYQHAVEVSYARRTARAPRITLTDPARRTEAQARVDRVARGESAGEEDRALAGLVYACGLDARWYRGVRGRALRERLARLGEQQEAAAAVQAASAEADVVLADAIARVLADVVEQLNRELIRLAAPRVRARDPPAPQQWAAPWFRWRPSWRRIAPSRRNRNRRRPPRLTGRRMSGLAP